MDRNIFDIQRFATISNSTNNTIITGTEDADSIVNSGDNVSINLVGGNDTLSNTGANVTVTSENISLTSDALRDGYKLVISVDNSSSIPHITIPSGIAYGSTLSVGAGVYNVGYSEAVTVNESTGYLYIDSNGNVTAEDNSVANIRIARDNAIATLVATLNGENTTVQAFKDFYNLYDNFPSTFTSTVAGYDNGSVTNPATTESSTGVNIYGDKALGANPEQITLQSYLSDPINIEHRQGATDGAIIKIAVVDASKGSASVIALGMNSVENSFASNYMILGSNNKSTIMIGSQASGDNVVRAGSVGSYLYHNAGGQSGRASIFGNVGNDTIIAEEGDHVEGGGGVDYFYDTGSYEISDYNFEQGDVIVATKLSANITLTPDKLSLSENKISVADGATLTLGSDYDGGSVSAAITNADGSTSRRNYLAWAGTDASVVDASNFSRGAMVISNNNGNISDTIIGSAYADTIYAGSGDYVNAGAGNDIISLDSDHSGVSVVLSSGRNTVYNFNVANDTIIVDSSDYNSRVRNGTLYIYEGGASLAVDGLSTDTQLENLNILVTSTIAGGTTTNNTVNNIAITGTEYADTISNSGSNVTIKALAGNDSIRNSGSNVTIDGGAGNDTIINTYTESNSSVSGSYGNYASINGGEGNDKIENYCSDVTINGDSGNDYIYNYGNNVTINGGEGDDTIELNGEIGVIYQYNDGDGNDVIIGYTTSDTLIMGSTASETLLSGNDWIFKSGENTITLKDAASLAPNNVFNNNADNTVITGTAYADIINNSGSNVTINGNGEDDTITNTGSKVVYQYSSGDGNDIITGFTTSDTLIISSDTYRMSVSGNDLIVTVIGSQNTITLKDASNITPIIKGESLGAANITVNNTIDNTLITGSVDADSIVNSGNNVTINALSGNDTIQNSGSDAMINGGEGADYFFDYGSAEIADYNFDEGDVIVATKLSATKKLTVNDIVVDGNKIAVAGGSTITVGSSDDYEDAMATKAIVANAAVENTVNVIWSGHYETKLDVSTLSSGALMISKGSEYTYNTIVGSEYADTIYADSYDSVKAGAGDDIISVTGYTAYGDYYDSTTVNGGEGNDTIYTAVGVRNGNVYQYSAGDGNDVIVGFNSNDTLYIDGDSYSPSVSGNDLIVSIVGSQNTITLKDSANITPKINGDKYGGYLDKSGNKVENPVAQIEVDGTIYYYGSVAEATNDAENNSTVTVTANSTETSAINATKGLTIQFAESGLGIYSVTGGNFISADSSREFSISSNRVLSNSNSLLINNGATATVDGYKVTGTSNGYSFTLQDNDFIIPYTSIPDSSSVKLSYLSYKGSGTATFTTSGTVSVTSGAIITYETGIVISSSVSNTKPSDVEITIAEGNYTINGVDFSVASQNTAVIPSDSVKFNLSSDTVTYNAMTFNGAGTATIQSDTGISLTGGAVVSNVAAGQEFIFDGVGTYKINNKTIVSSATSLTVTNTDNGLTIDENTFSVTGDDEYRINVDANGNILSVSGIDGDSTIISSGSADLILTSSEGNFTFAQDNNKVFNIGGDDSVTFGLSSDGTVTKIADIVGTVSGDFTTAININGNDSDVWIAGDSSVTLTTESSGVSTISGLSDNAIVKSVGGASIIVTDEEGSFNFYDSQHVTVSGDNSVEFIQRDSIIMGVGDFESGTFIFDNTAQISVNADSLSLGFTDTATFVIADSQVVSVNGVESYINGLTSDATVRATGSMTVNSADINVAGDNDFNVIVSDGKTNSLANISAGASVSVANVNVTTDNNGNFKFGEYVYSVNDSDGSVTFITNSTGSVENIIGLNGTLKTTARNVTINGGTFTTTNTDVTISSAGANITRVEGLDSGDTIGGNLDSSTVVMPSTTNTDISVLTINERTYTLENDSDDVLLTGNRIDGLNSGASLTVGAAGSYIVNNTALTAQIGDVFIGTAEGSAYVFDPNNIPLNVETMSDDELAAQVGISTDYSTYETDTEKVAALLESNNLNGNMELALSNSDTTAAQTADFSESTGKKKVTLAEGSQDIKFNDAGGNVAIVDADSTGEKKITLGNGGDLAIVKDTATPVNITAGTGKDTIVTAGNNVTVDITGGATRIVANGGNVNLMNYDAATGAGIQINDFSDIRRAVANDNISLNNGTISFDEMTVVVNDTDSESTTVNLYDNTGKKQKVAYTHNDGGRVDASGERENLLLVGNKNMDKGNSSLVSGRGNDTAMGGAGDYFDLGAGNNLIYLNENRNGSESGATIAITTSVGRTEVYGFQAGFNETADKVSLDITNAQISFKNGKLTFDIGRASLVLNFMDNYADLVESADLISDDNFLGDTRLDDITPIIYEQGEYKNLYDTPLASSQDTLPSGTSVTFANV